MRKKNILSICIVLLMLVTLNGCASPLSLLSKGVAGNAQNDGENDAKQAASITIKMEDQYVTVKGSTETEADGKIVLTIPGADGKNVVLFGVAADDVDGNVFLKQANTAIGGIVTDVDGKQIELKKDEVYQVQVVREITGADNQEETQPEESGVEPTIGTEAKETQGETQKDLVMEATVAITEAVTQIQKEEKPTEAPKVETPKVEEVVIPEPMPEPVQEQKEEPAHEEPQPVQENTSNDNQTQNSQQNVVVSYQPVVSAHVNKEWAMQCLDYQNQLRGWHGLPALQWNDSLYYQILNRGVEISQRFEHTRPDGSGYETAIAVPHRMSGENIAAGYWSAGDVTTDWYLSDGHRGNMLNQNFHSAAVVCYYDPNSAYGYYWVTIFVD